MKERSNLGNSEEPKRAPDDPLYGQSLLHRFVRTHIFVTRCNWQRITNSREEI